MNSAFSWNRGWIAAAVLTLPFLTGADGRGCKPGGVIPIGGGGMADAAGATCTASDCAGLVATQDAKACPDGTFVARTVCAKQSDGHCGWDFPACPTPQDGGSLACDRSQCGPEPPVVPCIDATTSVTCVRHNDGTCGWNVECLDAGAPDAQSSCCPSGWSMYSCTYPSGTNGLQCHNPSQGCASSSVCGQSCDAIVSGRCGSPCDGKICGDPCSDGRQANVLMYCDLNGGCGLNVPVCSPPASRLHWESTCGFPVCGNPELEQLDSGAPSCGAIHESDPCTDQDTTCNPGLGCGVLLRCTNAPIDKSMCPISSERYKKDINYLTDSDLAKVANNVQKIKLATYYYKDQLPEEQKHLGFIIEDNPKTPAVFMSRDRVDLYGYASMAIAALQVQNRQIQAMEQELESLRAEIAESKGTSLRCGTAR
jgi:hypothetical protein